MNFSLDMDISFGSDDEVDSENFFVVSPSQDHKIPFSKSQVSRKKHLSSGSDSATSTEISFTQTSDSSASKGILGNGFQKIKIFSHHTPSAPLMADSGPEMSQSVDQISALGGHHKSCTPREAKSIPSLRFIWCPFHF